MFFLGRKLRVLYLRHPAESQHNRHPLTLPLRAACPQSRNGCNMHEKKGPNVTVLTTIHYSESYTALPEQVYPFPVLVCLSFATKCATQPLALRAIVLSARLRLLTVLYALLSSFLNSDNVFKQFR
jgi:hypothetical protein